MDMQQIKQTMKIITGEGAVMTTRRNTSMRLGQKYHHKPGAHSSIVHLKEMEPDMPKGTAAC
jgi:hypothetical protein